MAPSLPRMLIDPAALRTYLTALIASELDLPASAIKPNASLRRTYALDSVAAVNLLFQIENDLRLEIDAELLVTVDTVEQLCTALVALGGDCSS